MNLGIDVQFCAMNQSAVISVKHYSVGCFLIVAKLPTVVEMVLKGFRFHTP